MSDQFSMLYHQHVGMSLEKQLTLQAWAGELDWQFDLSSGILSLSDGTAWQTQVLGTESESSGTWRWGWANEQSSVPGALLRHSLSLKSYGRTHGVPELTVTSIPLDEFQGHDIALVATGVCNASAYYRCPYEGGSLYVLFDDLNLPCDHRPVQQRILSTFPQVLARSALVDHRGAFEAYLQTHELSFADENGVLIVQARGKKIIQAEFDRMRRLVRLEGEFIPDQ